MTAKKCTKKQDGRVVVMLIKPLALLPLPVAVAVAVTVVVARVLFLF